LEETHLTENVLYNDLNRRGFDLDVGVVEQNVRDDSGKNIRKQLEVDFKKCGLPRKLQLSPAGEELAGCFYARNQGTSRESKVITAERPRRL